MTSWLAVLLADEALDSRFAAWDSQHDCLHAAQTCRYIDMHRERVSPNPVELSLSYSLSATLTMSVDSSDTLQIVCMGDTLLHS